MLAILTCFKRAYNMCQSQCQVYEGKIGKKLVSESINKTDGKHFILQCREIQYAVMN